MFDKILVAIDGSDTSLKALDKAMLLAEQKQSEITLLAVGKIFLFPSAVVIDINLIREALEEQYDEVLKDAQARVNEKGIASKIVYREGDPAQQILEFANEGDYDLIIMGSRGLGGFKEVILGSVSHKVAQLARCPVLIVK